MLRTLLSLNGGVLQVFPASAKAQVSMLKLSFDIPFLPNIQKYSEFVGETFSRT